MTIHEILPEPMPAAQIQDWKNQLLCCEFSQCSASLVLLP